MKKSRLILILSGVLLLGAAIVLIVVLTGKPGRENGGWIPVEPGQALPTAAGAESSADEAQGPGETLQAFSVTEDGMRRLWVGEQTEICFTVRCAEPAAAPLQLICLDTGETMGTLLDDGRGPDSAAGDGVYSCGIRLLGSRYGRLDFAARQEDQTSNRETIRFYELPGVQNERAVTELMDAGRAINARYADESGFVAAEDRQAALEAMKEFVREQYLKGAVAEYAAAEDTISFREIRTGLSMTYSPPDEELLSAGLGTKVVLALPYENEKRNGDNKVESGVHFQVRDQLLEWAGYHWTEYLDENVLPELFERLQPGQILLWHGHGDKTLSLEHTAEGLVTVREHPVLLTGVDYDFVYHYEHGREFLNGSLGVELLSIPPRVYVTSRYIDDHCPQIDGALIWLGACCSCVNGELAQSFLRKGADAVVGFSWYVFTFYDNLITWQTMGTMIPAEGERAGRPLREAIDGAMAIYGRDDIVFWDLIPDSYERPSADKLRKKPAEPLIFGNEAYRLVSNLPQEEQGDETSWIEAYGDFIREEAFYRPGRLFADREMIAVTLCDLDGNQTPELLIYNGIEETDDAVSYVFTYDSGGIRYLGEAGAGCPYVNDHSAVIAENRPGMYFYPMWIIENEDWARVDHYVIGADGRMTCDRVTDDALWNWPVEYVRWYSLEQIARIGWEKFVLAPFIDDILEVEYTGSQEYVPGEPLQISLSILNGTGPFTVWCEVLSVQETEYDFEHTEVFRCEAQVEEAERRFSQTILAQDSWDEIEVYLWATDFYGTDSERPELLVSVPRGRR